MAPSDRTSDNFIPVLHVKSNAGNGNDVVLWGDPTTHRLLVDVSGGGIQVAEDDKATFTAGTTQGTPVMGARDDASTSTLTEGTLGIIRATEYRGLHVNLRDASGNEVSVSGGTQYTEDAASAGGESLTLAGAVRQDTIASATSADGDYAYLKVNSVGRLYTSTTIDSALPAGTNGIGKLTANSGVIIGSVEIAAAQTLATVTNVATIGTSITPGTSAAHLGKAEDAAHTSGDTGVFMLKVANEAQSTLASDGDYIASATDTKGNTMIVGNVAHDGADAGAPVKIGGKAVSAEPSAVSAADRANLITDLVGKLIVLPYANPENFVSGTTSAMTGTTSTQVIAAPAAGLRNYITQITVTNSHATVSTFVTIRDGDGGTVLFQAYALAEGGGFSITFPVPLRQPTTATRLDVKNETTGSNIIANVTGYKGV